MAITPAITPEELNMVMGISGEEYQGGGSNRYWGQVILQFHQGALVESTIDGITKWRWTPGAVNPNSGKSQKFVQIHRRGWKLDGDEYTAVEAYLISSDEWKLAVYPALQRLGFQSPEVFSSLFAKAMPSPDGDEVGGAVFMAFEYLPVVAPDGSQRTYLRKDGTLGVKKAFTPIDVYATREEMDASRQDYFKNRGSGAIVSTPPPYTPQLSRVDVVKAVLTQWGSISTIDGAQEILKGIYTRKPEWRAIFPDEASFITAPELASIFSK